MVTFHLHSFACSHPLPLLSENSPKYYPLSPIFLLLLSIQKSAMASGHMYDKDDDKSPYPLLS